MIILFSFCFAIFAVIGSMIARLTDLSWQVKFATVCLAGFLVGAFGWSLAQAMGWPAAARPAGTLELLWYEAHEPLHGEPGLILALVETPGDDLPRLLRLPYSKQAHETMQDASSDKSHRFISLTPSGDTKHAGSDEQASGESQGEGSGEDQAGGDAQDSDPSGIRLVSPKFRNMKDR